MSTFFFFKYKPDTRTLCVALLNRVCKELVLFQHLFFPLPLKELQYCLLLHRCLKVSKHFNTCAYRFFCISNTYCSISSPTFILNSTLPVTTVPLPEIENTSSTALKMVIFWSIGWCFVYCFH